MIYLFIFIVYSRPSTQKEREEHAPHLRELPPSNDRASTHMMVAVWAIFWNQKGVFEWPGFDGKLGTTWNYILGVLFFQIETAAGTLHKSLARVQCIDGNEANLETLILLLKQNHVQKVFWTATPHCSRVNPHGGYGWRWSRHLYKFWWIFDVFYPEILGLSSFPLWKKSPFCSTPSTSSFDTSKYHSVHNYTHYIPPSCLLTQVWYC